MIDKYKVADYKKRLEKEDWKQGHHLKMIYMWVKQDIITLAEFKELIFYCIRKEITNIRNQIKTLTDESS
jgi:hypothetical protein